jgi:hypothetical protein
MPTTTRASEEEFQRRPDNPPMATEPLADNPPEADLADVGNPPAAPGPERQVEEQADDAPSARGHEKRPTLAQAARAHVSRTAPPDTTFGVNAPQLESTDRAPNAQAGQAHAKAVVAEVARADDEEEALFRCENSPALVQYLPEGGEARFAGQFFRTKDPQIIRQMRGMIDGAYPGVVAQFYEDDPQPVFRCPFCDFLTTKQASLRGHMRTQHPGLKLPKPDEE